ncbi:MAG: hypothetical protein ACRCTQ_03525 [Brevinemataceae bacterium]
MLSNDISYHNNSLAVSIPLSSNDLSPTGVIIQGDISQSSSIFKSKIAKNFNENISQSVITKIITSEQTKQDTLSNIFKISGSFLSNSGNLDVEFVNNLDIKQTNTIIFKEVIRVLGTYEFDFLEAELLDSIKDVFDPTTQENSDPIVYKNKISHFLSTYGYYYISSYQVYSSLIGSWDILTDSVNSNKKVSSDLEIKMSVNPTGFSLLDQYVKEVSSTITNSNTQFHALGIGVAQNIQTIDQLNSGFENFADIAKKENASVAKIFISPWTSLPQISQYLLKIQDKNLFIKIQTLMNSPNLNQDIWDSACDTIHKMRAFQTTLKKSIDNPYENKFWGFLVPYDELPITQIQEIVTKLDVLITAFSAISSSNFNNDYLEFKKQHEQELNSLYADFIKYTTPFKYQGILTTVTYHGDDQNSEKMPENKESFIFDPYAFCINQEIVKTNIQKRYFVSAAREIYQQSYLTFRKNTNNTNATICPFFLELTNEFSWTGHPEPHRISVNTEYDSKTKKLTASITDKEKFLSCIVTEISTISLINK